MKGKPMKKSLLFGVLIVLLLVCVAAQAAERRGRRRPAAQPGAVSTQENWANLFDGKTLNGWTVKSGSATYTVEDGAIVGSTVQGSPNTFLCTDKEYSNFILELEVKDDPKLNSGVQVRSHTYAAETAAEPAGDGGKKAKRTFPPGRVYGYQVEISNEAAGTSGGIYDEARSGWLANIAGDPAASKAFKDNQWNKYRIECRGNTIKTWVNGVPCANLTDSKDASGFIGLQVHQIKTDTPLHVQFRNIRIQELK
jgi:hypothetical protein